MSRLSGRAPRPDPRRPTRRHRGRPAARTRTQELVARAARGIEEEVYQAFGSLCGSDSPAASRPSDGPVVLDRVDDTTVANPILWEKGIRTMLGVPRSSATSDRCSPCRKAERASFHCRGRRAAGAGRRTVAFATQTRLLEVERAAARLLERSLLPRRCPPAPGSRWPPATSPQMVATWAATGTTCSSSPLASYGL